MKNVNKSDIIIVQDMHVPDFQSRVNQLVRRGYAMVRFAAVGVPEHSKYKSELTAVMQLKK